MIPIRLGAIHCEGESSLRIDTPSGPVGVRRGSRHPLLGPADEICSGAFERLTAVGRIDWRLPDRIPPVLEPARLPPGAGTALLNAIAEAATGPLRYRGPYPTAALYASLEVSFRPSAPVEVFCAGVEDAAVAGREVEPDIWFEPAPFARFRTGELIVEVKDEGVTAIYVGAARFDGRGQDGRWIERRQAGAAALFAVPGNPAVELAVADSSGRVVAAPGALPTISGGHLGKPLPNAVSRAVYATALSAAPALLRPAVSQLADRPLVWADTGLALARIDGEAIAIHGNLAIGDLDPADLLVTLVDAAVPVALRLAQRQLAAEGIS